MARCIPYTRPNYCREDVFMIGSIKKLQIQWGNTKQRKQLTRKVTVKQNKKRSREDHDNLDSLQRKNKKRKADKNIKFNKSFHFARKEFSDHLERSDLSEELDPPALVLNKCNSSKGTQNSKNGNAVMDSDPKKQKPGMVIRIKLPVKKQKDPEPESATTNPSFSSIFTKSSTAQAFFTDSAPCSSSQATEPSDVQAILTEYALRTKELQPETISQPSISAPFSTPPILQERWSSGGNCTQRSEWELFRDLIINWKPPSIRRRLEADEAELDWLFATRKSQDAKPSAQICEAGVSNPSTASSLQPRATYLPEFKMYQMPYVIPF